MLFENKKQVTAEQLMLKYATAEDYRKLLKAPSFEVTKDRKKVDRINGNRIKSPKALMMRSHFLATDKATKLKVEIRYAESHVPKAIGERVVDQFEPRYIQTTGQAFAFQHNIDLAVYLFLHPNNTLSTLKNQNVKAKSKFEFIDTKKRAQAKNSAIDELSDALIHAKTLSEDELLVFAKGLGIKGLDKKDLEDVRADVREFAVKYPKIYNEKAKSQVTMIEGRIVNLIDKGAVKLQTVGNVRRWSWTVGEREGEHIMDILNPTQDARQALKNFFFNDITTYMGILENINTDLSVKQKLEMTLAAMNNSAQNSTSTQEVPDRVIGDALPPHLADVPQAITGASQVFNLPIDNPSAMELLSSLREGDTKASWGHVKQLMEAIASGVVKETNFREWVRQNLGY